jgi:hypothetical protein
LTQLNNGIINLWDQYYLNSDLYNYYYKIDEKYILYLHYREKLAGTPNAKLYLYYCGFKVIISAGIRIISKLDSSKWEKLLNKLYTEVEYTQQAIKDNKLGYY